MIEGIAFVAAGTDGKNYACNFCGRRFTWRDSGERHLPSCAARLRQMIDRLASALDPKLFASPRLRFHERKLRRALIDEARALLREVPR